MAGEQAYMVITRKYLNLCMAFLFLFFFKTIYAEFNNTSDTTKIDPAKIEQFLRKSENADETKEQKNILKKTNATEDTTGIKEFPLLKEIKETPQSTEKEKKYSDIPSLSDIYSGQITQIIDQQVKPFGYDVFSIDPANFSAFTNIPVGPDYLLGPGDSIIIDVWGGATQNLALTVDRDGKIVIPSVGSLYVTGIPFSQLKDLIKNKLSKEYQNIDVEVTVGKLKTFKIYIVGEVKRPGSYDISSLATVYNALFFAGGPNERGSLRNIEVIRDEKTIATIDLYDFLLTGNRTNDIQLKNGDTIFVHLIGNTAGISGMVKRPGIYEFRKQLSLKEFIELGGDILPAGYLKNIQVQRIINNENKIILNLNIEDANNSYLKDFIIQDNDFVKIFPILPIERKIIYIKGHLFRPGKYELKQNMSLRDIISSYDILLPEPSENYAQIIRLNGTNYHPLVIPFNLGNLLKGDEKENIILQPYDTIIIFSKWDFHKEPEVSIEGEVRKPGKHRLFAGMKLSDLIFLGGGIKSEAYLEENQLFRVDGERKEELIQFNLKKILSGENKENIILKDEDRVVIRNIWELRDKPFVTIEGAIRKPGKYPLIKDMRVNDIISLAGNIKKDAFLEEYQIIRVRKDREIEIQTYNLNKALAGDPDNNVVLCDEDNVNISNLWDKKEIRNVTIEGEVMKPGKYRLGEKMTLRDLIYQAGYLKESAYLKESEIIRYSPQQEGVVVKKINVDLEKVLQNNSDENIVLSNMDKIFIKRIPNWEDIGASVKILGEVAHAGTYSINKDEPLSKVIERAGGFIDTAYLEGAVLTRVSVKEIQKARLQEMILKLEQEVLRNATVEAASATSSDDAKGQAIIIQSQKDLLEKIKNVEPTGRIIIRLQPIEQLKGTKDDIALKNEDILYIPKKTDVVLITGEVYNPTAVIYEKDFTVRQYLSKVGGPTKSADKSNIYVIKVDGTVLSSENSDEIRNLRWWNPFSWFRNTLLSMELTPGDTILVPEKIKYPHLMRDIKDVTTILYNIAVTAKVWETIK